MKPKTQDATAFELFQAHFNQILNPEYSLVRLMENNPYDGLRTASRLADSPAAQVGLFQGRTSYRHGPRRGAGLSGSIQQNRGLIQAAFFDGSVRTLNDRESRNPVHWYPRGTKVKNDAQQSQMMLETLRPGDLVP